MNPRSIALPEQARSKRRPSNLDSNAIIQDPRPKVSVRRIDEHDPSPCKSHSHVNDDFSTLHERLIELTAILATGIHRIRAIHSALPECAQSPADSLQTGLDQGREFALMEAGLQPESEVSDDVD